MRIRSYTPFPWKGASSYSQAWVPHSLPLPYPTLPHSVWPTPLAFCYLRHCFCPASPHFHIPGRCCSDGFCLHVGLPAHSLLLPAHLSFPKDKPTSFPLKISCRTRPKLLALVFKVPCTSQVPAGSVEAKNSEVSTQAPPSMFCTYSDCSLPGWSSLSPSEW